MYKYFDLNGVVLYLDDVLACTQIKEENDVILDKMVKIAGLLIIKCNMNQLQFRKMKWNILVFV